MHNMLQITIYNYKRGGDIVTLFSSNILGKADDIIVYLSRKKYKCYHATSVLHTGIFNRIGV